MKYSSLEMRFDAYPKRQFATESININSLAYHHIWSTIKTIPATLPGPRSVVRGSRFDAQGPSFTNHGPGLLEPFLTQIWMSVRGWGRVHWAMLLRL